MVHFHQNLSEKALSDVPEVYIVLSSLACGAKTNQWMYPPPLPLDILMTEGSLHSLFSAADLLKSGAQ